MRLRTPEDCFRGQNGTLINETGCREWRDGYAQKLWDLPIDKSDFGSLLCGLERCYRSDGSSQGTQLENANPSRTMLGSGGYLQIHDGSTPLACARHTFSGAVSLRRLNAHCVPEAREDPPDSRRSENAGRALDIAGAAAGIALLSDGSRPLFNRSSSKWRPRNQRTMRRVAGEFHAKHWRGEKTKS